MQDIDLLVLGLPVSHYLQSKPAEYLKDKYRNSKLSVGGKTFSIGEVSVLPQPLGSYLLLGEFVSKINTEFRRVGRDPIKDVSDLVGMPIMVMDPGQETMDWIVYQDGVVIQDASCAEVGHGRMHIIQHVAEHMERDSGINIKWGSRVDMNMALLQKKPIFVTGKRIETGNYVNVAKAAAGDSVDLVLTRVGNMLDRIQMIVVAGGHPDYYVEYLRTKLPNVPVIDSGLGIFGNVPAFYSPARKQCAGPNKGLELKTRNPVRYFKIQAVVYVSDLARPELYRDLERLQITAQQDSIPASILSKMQIERLLDLAEMGLSAESSEGALAPPPTQAEEPVTQPDPRPEAAKPPTHQHGALETPRAEARPDAGLGQDGGIITLSQSGGNGLSRYIR